MAHGRYGPTALRFVVVGDTAYLGGGCRRFGCTHTFIQHDLGRPDGGPTGGGSGGACHGTNTSASGAESPCACPAYQDFG